MTTIFSGFTFREPRTYNRMVCLSFDGICTVSVEETILDRDGHFRSVVMRMTLQEISKLIRDDVRWSSEEE